MKFLFFTEADKKIREEIKEFVRNRELAPKKMKNIISEEEYITRIKRNLPCDNYTTINELMRTHGFRFRRN